MSICSFSTLLGSAIFATVTAALAQQPLPSIPLDKCTPEAAIVAASMDALGRMAGFAPRITASLSEVEAILARYPDHKNDQQPVMNFLSPADNVRVTELLATSAQLNMYSFAEQRAERDMKVMLQMLFLARAARDGKTDLMQRALATLKADEAHKPRTGGREEAGVVYLALLRHLFTDAADPAPPTVKDVCNVELALALEDGRAFAAFTSMVDHDPEFGELLRLRQKYYAADNQPLDTSRMPPTEAKYATEVQSAVQGKVQHMRDYRSDLLDMQRLATISRLRYDGQREDLLQTGGARDKEALAAMDAMDRARYKAASPEVQKMWGVWEQIDRENPPTFMSKPQQ